MVSSPMSPVAPDSSSAVVVREDVDGAAGRPRPGASSPGRVAVPRHSWPNHMTPPPARGCGGAAPSRVNGLVPTPLDRDESRQPHVPGGIGLTPGVQLNHPCGSTTLCVHLITDGENRGLVAFGVPGLRRRAAGRRSCGADHAWRTPPPLPWSGGARWPGPTWPTSWQPLTARALDAFLATLTTLPAGRSQALGPVHLVGRGRDPPGPDDRLANPGRGRVRRPGRRPAGASDARGRHRSRTPGGSRSPGSARAHAGCEALEQVGRPRGPRMPAGRRPRRVRLDQREPRASPRATGSSWRSPSRLLHAVPPGATVARIDGDQFLVVSPSTPDGRIARARRRSCSRRSPARCTSRARAW